MLFRLLKGFGRRQPQAASTSIDPPPAEARAQWERIGGGRAAEVGWLLDSSKAQFIWSAPRRVGRVESARTHAKSVDRCPAVLDYEARLWEVPCPIDARLRFARDASGHVGLVNVDGDAATIRDKHLRALVAMVGEKEWRHPERPIIQFITPYVFLADEPVWLTQAPPFARFTPKPWPGVVLGGRLPIHIWPRQMMWAFEWWDTAQDLVLVRGDPWFYVGFETLDPVRHVRMLESTMTPEVRGYLDGLATVANYVDQTFALFKTARERRPASLVVPKSRAAAVEESMI